MGVKYNYKLYLMGISIKNNNILFLVRYMIIV